VGGVNGDSSAELFPGPEPAVAVTVVVVVVVVGSEGLCTEWGRGGRRMAPKGCGTSAEDELDRMAGCNTGRAGAAVEAEAEAEAEADRMTGGGGGRSAGLAGETGREM
jgi:hypothetical protein